MNKLLFVIKRWFQYQVPGLNRSCIAIATPLMYQVDRLKENLKHVLLQVLLYHGKPVLYASSLVEKKSIRFPRLNRQGCSSEI